MTAAAVEGRYYGRDFTTAEMALLRALFIGPPALNRHALSKEFCRRIGWYKADGGVSKDMMARVVMLAMHGDGRIDVPRRSGARTGPGRSLSGPTPNRLGCRRRPRSTRSARSRCAPSCAATAGGSCGKSTSPATTTSATRRWSAPRCATPCTPATGAAGHARLLHRRLDARPARPLHRLVASTAREEPAARRRQPALPDPALDPHPQPRLAHPRPRPPPDAGGLDRALRDDPRAHRDLRGDPPLHRRRLPGPPAGSASAPPRGAATTARTTATSPRRTSGCGSSARTGSAPSTTGRIRRHAPARPNGYSASVMTAPPQGVRGHELAAIRRLLAGRGRLRAPARRRGPGAAHGLKSAVGDERERAPSGPLLEGGPERTLCTTNILENLKRRRRAVAERSDDSNGAEWSRDILFDRRNEEPVTREFNWPPGPTPVDRSHGPCSLRHAVLANLCAGRPPVCRHRRTGRRGGRDGLRLVRLNGGTAPIGAVSRNPPLADSGRDSQAGRGCPLIPSPPA